MFRLLVSPISRRVFACSVVLSSVSLGLFGCANEPTAGAPVDEPLARPGLPAAPTSLSRLRSLRERFGNLFVNHANLSFELTATQSLRIASMGADATAALELPGRASGMAMLKDRASGLSIRFALEGATDALAEADQNILYYRAATAEGHDLLHVPNIHGTEDFIAVTSQGAEPLVRYQVEMGDVRGLRLVDNTLEMLDERGIPRLRVAPPYVVDARGVRREASLSVENCAISKSPAAPWTLPLPAKPGPSCAIAIRYVPDGLAYPLLVDPAWQTTAPMVHARTRAVLAEAKGPGSLAPMLLVAGGFDAAGDAMASAELYFPLERVFAATSPMNAARGAATATNTTENHSGPIFIAGGASSTSASAPGPLRSTELYDPGAGTFSPSIDMPLYRFEHTTILLEDGRLLVAGGTATSDPATLAAQSTDSAEVINLSTNTIVSITNGMLDARSGHGAKRIAGDPASPNPPLKKGQVLMTGGIGTAGFAVFSTELFDPATMLFSAGPTMNAGRMHHTMTEIDSTTGDILIAGGANVPQGAGSYTSSAQIYEAKTNTLVQAGAMSLGRAHHTATRLPSGQIALVGGTSHAAGQNAVYHSGVDLFDPATKTFSATAPMQINGISAPRADHVAALVPTGAAAQSGTEIVAIGGVSGDSQILSSALVFFRALGDDCKADAECHSGHCADIDETTELGVCCDAPCNATCSTCRKTKKGPGGSDDGFCGFTAQGTMLGWNCVLSAGNQIPVEFQQVCDGNGNPVPLAGNSCFGNNCDANDERCATECPCNGAGYCTNIDPDEDPFNPHCVLKRDHGEKCYLDDQCQSGFCVDGFCCKTACTGQCQACNVTGYLGECKPAGMLVGKTTPVGNRPACDGALTGGICQGYCGPLNEDSCAYPGGDEKASSACVCVGPTCTQVNTVCDGQGGTTTADLACNAYACNDEATECKTECESDKDCNEDGYCEKGGCKKLPSEGRCDGDHIIRIPVGGINPDGADSSCEPARCEPETSQCMKSCVSALDCIAPFVCSLDGACVAPPQNPAPSGCSLSHTPIPSGNASFMASLIALVATLRRARKRLAS